MHGEEYFSFNDTQVEKTTLEMGLYGPLQPRVAVDHTNTPLRLGYWPMLLFEATCNPH